MNRILDEDRALCEFMIKNAESENEKLFFKKILKKETEEISLSGDLLLSEHDNQLGVYIFREIYDEFRVGINRRGPEFPEKHIDGISNLLKMSLREIGVDMDGSLGDWLKKNDYIGINYKANSDIH